MSFVWADELITFDLAPERRLNIVPANEYEIEPQAIIFNLRAPETKAIELIGDVHGKGVQLDLGDGFDIAMKANQLNITPNGANGVGLKTSSVQIDGQRAMQVERMQFDHTGKMTFAQDLAVNILTLDVKFSDAPVGYVAGGSDVSDKWLREMGMHVVSISDEEIARGQLSKYRSILVGVFAFRTRPVLSQNLDVLHQWVRDGGNLVTLYHRPWDNWDSEKTALAPITIGKPSLRWRVTNQNADVHVLAPEHQVLNHPNQISNDDWAGWHKERGLYFASAWGPQYTPILSMSDEGEVPLEGALLIGQFGKGRHTHTSLILHHQLTQLVPGTFRLMANLLAPCA